MQEQKSAKPIPVKVAMAKVTIPSSSGVRYKTVSKTPEELTCETGNRHQWHRKTKVVKRDRDGQVKRLKLMHEKLGEFLTYLDSNPNAEFKIEISDRDDVYAELVVMGHRLETQDEANKRAKAARIAAAKQRIADEKKLAALTRTALRRRTLVEEAQKRADAAAKQAAKLAAKLAK